MAETIPQFIDKYKDLEDKGLLWEMVKMEIRSFRACLHEGGGPQVGEVRCGGLPHLTCKRDHIKMRDYMDRRATPPKRVTSPIWDTPPPCKQALTITYTKTKAKQCRNQEIFLTKEAERLQNLVDSQSTPEHINKHMAVKSKLEKISFDRFRGAYIRSKARWQEFGERSSKYFLNLEKRNYENKCISSLKIESGSSISDPEEALQEQKSYYQNLYSSQNPQVDDPRFHKFFQNEMI